VARQHDLLLNIERMRREMDELLGDAWSRPRLIGRRPSSFSPRIDVYYCREDGDPAAAKAVVKVELAGVDPDAVALEIAGRELVVSGERPVRETEGRGYQQVEIPTGQFRRVIELGVEVDAAAAKATFDNGILRVELPVRVPEASARQVPIDRARE
jgi:HSP20 family protein